MHRLGAPWCPLALLVMLPVARGQGPWECQEQAVSAGGELQLLPEKPPQGWVKVEWRLKMGAQKGQRILTAEVNRAAQYSQDRFSGRVTFQQETLSLRISPVSPADSGVYHADFEDSSGFLTPLCFHVSVWEPVHQPHLKTHILHWERDWCNISLLCAVPGASNISYNWSCAGRAPEHQSQLYLEVPRDAEPTVCHCNASNPVSWRVASADVTCHEATTGTFSLESRWAVAVFLALSLLISLVLGVTCYWQRKRRKTRSEEHVDQTLTVYMEVGRPRTIRDTDRTSEATVGGNTTYAAICSSTQGPSWPQDPASCTIYSTVQHTRKSPSIKRKKLDSALVSTAYIEATEGSRRLCPPLWTLPPAPAGHHLS